jgi:D-alanyl-D-alanine carboxypeptidase
MELYMDIKQFKILFYIILILSILVFFTQNIFLFRNHFYKNIKEIDNPYKIDVIVNKNNKLSYFYRPYDLVKLNENYAYQDKYLRNEAAINFEKLSEEAKELGYNIIVVSAYRSYFYQNVLYNNYIDTLGEEKALLASAKPGHSEHQTGLSIDVATNNISYSDFESTNEFKWLKNNAHKYGFILRYPKGKENITGFKYEPWHYRYVGVELATYLYETNKVLEEIEQNSKINF